MWLSRKINSVGKLPTVSWNVGGCGPVDHDLPQIRSENFWADFWS